MQSAWRGVYSKPSFEGTTSRSSSTAEAHLSAPCHLYLALISWLDESLETMASCLPVAQHNASIIYVLVPPGSYLSCSAAPATCQHALPWGPPMPWLDPPHPLPAPVPNPVNTPAIAPDSIDSSTPGVQDLCCSGQIHCKFVHGQMASSLHYRYSTRILCCTRWEISSVISCTSSFDASDSPISWLIFENVSPRFPT